jgi:tetratricopeptide (TPR) repeat protein
MRCFLKVSAVFSFGVLLSGTPAPAQSPAAQQGSNAPSNAGPSSGNLAAPNTRVGSSASPLTVDNSLELMNSKERDDYKKFETVSPEDVPKKIKSGEDFLKKYQNSPARAQVYAQLAVLYIQANQLDKGFAAGSSALQLNPNDVRTMGVLSQTMARTANAGEPGADQRLKDAEKYGKQAVTVAPTLVKPASMDDKFFEQNKNDALSMAHSGLGTVYVREGKYADAIPDLKQAIELQTRTDPTNYYLLGVASLNSGHNADAATAFAKCAETPGNLQAACKENADKAKSHPGS